MKTLLLTLIVFVLFNAITTIALKRYIVHSIKKTKYASEIKINDKYHNYIKFPLSIVAFLLMFSLLAANFILWGSILGLWFLVVCLFVALILLISTPIILYALYKHIFKKSLIVTSEINSSPSNRNEKFIYGLIKEEEDYVEL